MVQEEDLSGSLAQALTVWNYSTCVCPYGNKNSNQPCYCAACYCAAPCDECCYSGSSCYNPLRLQLRLLEGRLIFYLHYETWRYLCTGLDRHLDLQEI